jgi:Flp pilus assembly CpaF family ATPase
VDVMTNNLREINSLNQRGGRMLSVVDLIDDGTLDARTSGLLLSFMAAEASFLTAAGPGGVGKSTLMAVLLSFLRRAHTHRHRPGRRRRAR